MRSSMRIVVSGGGTGGHIYPALAIAAEFRRRGAEVLYMGCPDSMEQQFAANAGFGFVPVPAVGLRRRFPAIIRDLAVDKQGRDLAKQRLKEFAPQLVIGTGGFVSAPVLSAAQGLGIPTLIHEQNAFPGLANRFLARRAAAVCLTFAAAGEHFPHPERHHLTGLPLRPEIIAADVQAAREYFGFPADGKPLLLITGGSQGALKLNNAAAGSYEELLESGIRIIHLTGKRHYEQLKAAAPQHEDLLLLPYLEQMQHALVLADFIAARAGASFLAEAAYLGKPCLLAPYPFAANDHQRYNARQFAAVGAAVVVEDEQLNGATLAATVLPLLANSDKLKEMSAASRSLAAEQAAERIADIGYSLIK